MLSSLTKYAIIEDVKMTVFASVIVSPLIAMSYEGCHRNRCIGQRGLKHQMRL